MCERCSEIEAQLKEANAIIHNRAGGFAPYMRKRATAEFERLHNRVAELEAKVLELERECEARIDEAK